MVTVAVNSAVTLPPAILAPALFALTELVTVTLTWHPASLQLIWPSPCRPASPTPQPKAPTT